MGTDFARSIPSPGGRGPAHQVTLDPFFISKYEMTRGQWRQLTSSDPDS
jgi:formylglycine-generating enzyme required for sulfatase activity